MFYKRITLPLEGGLKGCEVIAAAYYWLYTQNSDKRGRLLEYRKWAQSNLEPFLSHRRLVTGLGPRLVMLFLYISHIDS
jgi:hypothetical protein